MDPDLDSDPDQDSDPDHWLLETKTKLPNFLETKKKHSEKNFPFLRKVVQEREGSGSGAGSIPVTNGSGRPKNMRIRIPNSSEKDFPSLSGKWFKPPWCGTGNTAQ